MEATGLHAPQGATNSVPALEDLSVGGWKALYQAKLREPPPTKGAAEPLAIEQANPFRTETTAKGNTATRFYYDAVPGLNPKQRERWAALDTNNNGSIEIEEIGEKNSEPPVSNPFPYAVDLERETRWLKDMLPLLTAIAALLLLAVFGVSLAGAVLAQTTEISASSEFAGPLLLGTGGSVDTIAKVAEAEQDVPLALLPLCTDDQLEIVQEITLSNLVRAPSSGANREGERLTPLVCTPATQGDIRTGTACATCAKHYHVHVDVKMRYSESKVRAWRQHRALHSMSRGLDPSRCCCL